MSFTDIDERILDSEWLDHPPLVEEWALKKANADHNVKQAKDRLALAKAQLRLRIRKYPSKFGLPEKATNDDVIAAIEYTQKFQEAQAELRDYEKEAGMAGAAMEALDHRRTAMSKCVELWQMNFRSEPRARNRNARRGLNVKEKC